MKYLTGLATLLMVVSIGFLAGNAWGRRESVSLVSLSPDERFRVHLVETNHWIDRNFQLRLERLGEGTTETIFFSPDEGEPIGTERIIWSPDSRRFVLVGRHFLVREGTHAQGRERFYLLYDVGSRKLRCNASQQSWPGFSPFEARDAAWAATSGRNGS